MELKILMLILLSQSHIGISTDFPWLIESCLEKLVRSDAKTAADSTNVIHKCFLEFGANLTYWDHPWIVSLYRGVFEAILCEEQGGCQRERRIRREYRLLSDDERREYHRSILKLYNDTTVPPNKFMALVLLHRDSHAQVAHGGPPFIIWHRIFLSMFEEALRQVSPRVVLPYWDMTIDQQLEDAAKSNIWTSEFIGNGFGKINQGFFNNWSHDRGYVTRYLGENIYLPSEKTIKKIVNFPYTKLESVHNNSHAFVGGDMQDPSVSPSDPVFWVLHCFYDLVWQEFIEKNIADGRSLVSTYPESSIYPLYRSLGLMPLTIGGALKASVLLGKHIFRFASRPSCATRNADNGCSSKYLECDRKTRVCRPTLRVCVDDDGPNLETFCDFVNCTSDWMQMEITIHANFPHRNARCRQLCSNVFPVNVYSDDRRQQTVLLSLSETNRTGMRLRVMAKRPALFSSLQVQDSCTNSCSCYFLSDGKYTVCDQKAINNMRRKKDSKNHAKSPTGRANQTLFAFKCGEEKRER